MGKDLRKEKGEDLSGVKSSGGKAGKALQRKGAKDLNRERGEKSLGGKGRRSQGGERLQKESGFSTEKKGEQILWRKREKVSGGKRP